MDLNPSDEQQQLIDAFAAFYAKECPVERVRAAEPSGHDADLWGRLRDMGALQMAVDEASGGWGASLLDLALVAEQHGRHLAPAPLMEGQVAARLLARAGGHAAAEALGRACTDGPAHHHRVAPADQDGVLAMVPAGAVADEVVFFARRTAAVHGDRRPWSPDIEYRIAAGGRHRGRRFGPGGPGVRGTGGGLLERARDEWLVLMANALVGIGTRSIEIGVDYVKERHAFGVPIGSFQAVAHGLADAATAVEGAPDRPGSGMGCG